jgi:hypothetical protein
MLKGGKSMSGVQKSGTGIVWETTGIGHHLSHFILPANSAYWRCSVFCLSSHPLCRWNRTFGAIVYLLHLYWPPIGYLKPFSPVSLLCQTKLTRASDWFALLLAVSYSLRAPIPTVLLAFFPLSPNFYTLEDVGSMFLRNIGKHIPNFKVSHPSSQ